MSHSLDFPGLYDRLFMLRHLIAGSQEFCRREGLYNDPVEGHWGDQWHTYSDHLRRRISSELIEIAAKVRVIQDSAEPELSKDDLIALDRQCTHGLQLGTVFTGDFQISIREACNKIIHAKTFTLQYQNDMSVVPQHPYSFWKGICLLEGTQAKKPWRLALNTYAWATALDDFLEDLAIQLKW